MAGASISTIQWSAMASWVMSLAAEMWSALTTVWSVLNTAWDAMSPMIQKFWDITDWVSATTTKIYRIWLKPIVDGALVIWSKLNEYIAIADKKFSTLESGLSWAYESYFKDIFKFWDRLSNLESRIPNVIGVIDKNLALKFNDV